MYFLLKDWKIYWKSNKKLKQEWYETIEADISDSDLKKIEKGAKYIDWEVVETEEYNNTILNEEKAVDISVYKELEKQAVTARTECLTIDLMPKWTLKDLKEAKSELKEEELNTRYEACIAELITKYGEDILQELV
jgi:hypothetical protein